MIIGFDGKRFYHNSSGLGNYSRSLVRMLSEEYPSDQYLLFNSKPVDEVNWTSVKTIWPESGKNRGYRSLGMAAHAAKFDVDVFHGLSNEIPFGLKKRGIRSVVTIHDVIFRRFPGYYPWIDRQVYHLKTLWAVKNADLIIATSEATAKDLVRYYQAKESKIKVVYQPVEPQFYSQSTSNSAVNAPYYLYVSSFNKRKNHLALLEAYAMILHQTDHHLVLAGLPGDTFQWVQQQIKKLKLTDRVHVFPSASEAQLHQLYSHADAFVYPSFFEGFGIPLGEAAAMKLPMAVSDISVFKELAGTAAVYFHPNHTQQMASTMLDLLLPEQRWRMAEGRKALLAKIDPKRLAAQLHAIYHSLA